MVDSLSILCILVSALISRSGVQGQAPVGSGGPCSRKTVWPAEGDGCAEEMSCPCSTCLPLPSGHQPGHTSHRHTGKLDQEQVAWVMGV